MQQNKVIILLAAVLLAVVAVSVGILYLIPGSPSSGPVDNATNQIQNTSSQPVEMNLGVLQQTEYQALNAKPVQEGTLPVQPPTGVGKANPFQ